MKNLFFTLCHSHILTSQLKKVAGLPGMGWLAEGPPRRRSLAATDKSIPATCLL
jgi:hypothetical protein